MHRMALVFRLATLVGLVIILGATAQAQDRVALPSLGSNIVITPEGTRISGHTSARKAGELLQIHGDLEIERLEVANEEITRKAEAKAIEALADPIKDGGEVAYTRWGDNVSFGTGAWYTYGQGMAGADPSMRRGAGGMVDCEDPNLCSANLLRLSGLTPGHMVGGGYGYTPAPPGMVTTSAAQSGPGATATELACGATVAECNDRFLNLQRELEPEVE